MKFTEQDRLLPHAERILKNAGHPLHYKELAELVAKAIAPAGIGGKDPAYKIYAYLYYDIRDNAMSSFVLAGRGVFAVKGMDLTEFKSRVPRRAGSKEPDVYDKMRERADKEKPYCRNCAHIEYEGIRILDHASGICGNFEESERLTAYPTDPPCAFWKRRTIAQRLKDQALSSEARVILVGYNAGQAAIAKKRKEL